MSNPPQLPPAQPSYIFRGHAAQIHALHFFRENSRLLSGDADGWVVLWNLVSRRPAAVWRPHQNAILGLDHRGDDIFTHGRDGTLKVWQLRADDEYQLSTTLPVDGESTHRKDPWLLHSLPVNTLNFCYFSLCTPSPTTPDTLLAVPGTNDSTISIHHLPSETLLHSIPAPPNSKPGMPMALSLLALPRLYLLAGWESGLASIQVHIGDGKWQTIYASTAHTQPILSLSATPDRARFFTSGADAVIACHSVPIPRASSTLLFADAEEPKVLKTGHAGQQSLVVRSDGRVFATAGWDGRVRVYSVKSMRELAVLKWHREGVYAVAFAEILGQSAAEDSEEIGGESGEGHEGVEVVKEGGGGEVVSVGERRAQETQQRHWLAAGSKDGKVSLWEIY